MADQLTAEEQRDLPHHTSYVEDIRDLRQKQEALEFRVKTLEAGVAGVVCRHTRLDADGICHICGTDCRGIG